MKIVATTKSCDACPNRRYRSGNRYECALVSQDILDLNQIAPFCPLPDFPAGIIAGMEQTIARLRAPHQYGFHLALLSHLAAKLKADLHPDGGGITIRCKDGKDERTVRFDIRCITELDAHTSSVTFMDNGTKYRIFMDTNPPQLQFAAEHEGQEYSRQLAID